MDKINKKGFTLVELLAVILLLGIIVSISIFTITSSIKKAREKSYQVTIKNIESQASNYLAENAGRLFFVSDDDGKEFQCVTVQNLIDFGYLKDTVTDSLIAEEKYVDKQDYIYLERNASTKAITTSKYIISDGDDFKCNTAIQAVSDIVVSVVPASGWVKQKQVKITYKLKNINDVNAVGNYLYGYIFDEQVEENNQVVKEFVVTNNGTLHMTIKHDGQIINSKDKEISGIDKAGPVVSLDEYVSTNGGHLATIPLIVTDEGIGADYSSFTKEDIIVKIGDEIIDNSHYELRYTTDNKYNLTITDNEHSGKVELIINSDNVIDKLGNGNFDIALEPDITFGDVYLITYDANGGTGAPEPTQYVYATSGMVNLSSVIPTKKGYTFTGWSTSKNATSATYSAGAEYSRNISNNVTLYAVWQINTVRIKLNANGGSLVNPSTSKYRLSDSGGIILKNGEVETLYEIKYGDGLDSTGLLNYNNSSYLNLKKTGYSVVSGEEWNTQADGGGITYNQDNVYSASDFCDLSSSSCEITLYVNWVSNDAPNITFAILASTSGSSGWYKELTLKVTVTGYEGNVTSCSTANNYCITDTAQYLDDDDTFTYAFETGSVEQRLCVMAFNSVGDSVRKCSTKYKVDGIAPVIESIINPTGGEATTSPFSLTLNGSDAGSGIKNWQYTYNENATSVGDNHNNYWIIYNDSNKNTFITTKFSAIRDQSVYIRACDVAGNCSDKESTHIHIVSGS